MSAMCPMLEAWAVDRVREQRRRADADLRARTLRLAAAAVSGVRRDGGLDPTPETRRKRVISAVAALLAERERGQGPGLDPACGIAAGEIAEVYRRTTSALWCKVGRYGDPGGGGSSAEWTGKLLDARARYLRWTGQPGQHRTVGAGRGTVLDVVIDAAVEGMGLRQIAERRRMDQRTVERVLRSSLGEYAVLAGWMTAAVAEAA